MYTMQSSQSLIQQCRALIGNEWCQTNSSTGLQNPIIITAIPNTQLYVLHLQTESCHHTNESRVISKHLSGYSNDKILLRLFADIWTAHQLAVQNIVYAILSERGIAPNLYGIIPPTIHADCSLTGKNSPINSNCANTEIYSSINSIVIEAINGGRLEQFFDCRTLTSKEMKDPRITNRVAEMLADFNRQSVPIAKDDNSLFEYLRNWLAKSKSVVLTDAKLQNDLKLLLNDRDWLAEINWLQDYLRYHNIPLVFSHNDLWEENILKIDAGLRFIDFEISSYNYRGYDIAHLFNNMSFNTECSEYPGFLYTPENYPTSPEILSFVTIYLRKFEPNVEYSGEKIQHIIKEIEMLSLLSHLFLTIFPFVKFSQCHERTFGFFQFALIKSNSYNDLKAKLLSTNDSKTN